MTDVKKQDHYTVNEIQPIEYIKNVMSPAEFRGHLWGALLKYTSRWPHKGKIEDLKKARVYLDWLIEFESTGEITVERNDIK
jgi:hypothetical protein